MISVGDLEVAPSNPSIVWVGTGEAVNPTLDWGDGVYKSVDAGKSWTRMGLEDSRHVGRIIIHPTNPESAPARPSTNRPTPARRGRS
jgi:hypothetical protein